MTQQQRADVWKRRDAHLANLNYAESDEEADELKAKIEACNTELISNTYNPPVEQVIEDGHTRKDL